MTNGCEILVSLGVWDLNDCCDSCHYDEPDYMLELEIPGHGVHFVCCSVTNQEDRILAKLQERSHV